MTSQSSFDSQVDFVLVTALPEERDAVLDQLPGYRQLPPVQDDIRTYYQVDLPIIFPDNSTGQYRVVVMCLLGMGRVQAATATTDAIRRWRPRYTLLVGIASGMADRNIQIGDILISDQIVDYESQKLTAQEPEIRWDVHRADPRLLNACNSYRSENWQESIQIERPGKGKPKRHTGPIASGDKVIAFDEVLARYRDVWPKLIGVEMEAAGVATAAFQSSDKPGFFMILGVSDLADENKNSPEVEKWRSYSCSLASSFAIAFLKSGPVPLVKDRVHGRETGKFAAKNSQPPTRNNAQLPENFSDLLKSFRTKKGLRQADLATKLYVARGTINNWENGNSLPRHRDDIIRLAEILELIETETDSLLRAAFYPNIGAGTLSATFPLQDSNFLPEYPDFVGRDDELAYYSARLITHHLAVIYGIPGVGKTAFASKLALETYSRKKIFWHEFKTDQGVEAIIEGIAGFLARNGINELWQILKAADQPGSKPPSREMLFQYIFQLVKGQGFLFCFDDFHYVDEDPVLMRYIERLRLLVRQGELTLLIGSRRRPAFVNEGDFDPLEGLNKEDVHTLLDSRGVKLQDQTQFEKLYRATEGNAEFLILAINVLKTSPDVMRSIEQLTRAQDIKRYLFREVFKGLPDIEAGVLKAISIFMGYPASNDAIAAIVEDDDVPNALIELVERELIRIQRNDTEETYNVHNLIERFSYDEMLSAERRRKMHQKAGKFYEDKEKDNFLAALHHERAGNFNEAARMATRNVEASLNKEYLQPLRTLLDRLEKEHIQPDLICQVKISLGYILARMGEGETAKQKYQGAMKLLESLPDTPARRELRAEACYRMGELWQFESLATALQWVNHGLKLVEHKTNRFASRFYLLKGEILTNKGELDEARIYTARGLELLPDAQGPLHIYGLSLLGMQAFYRGNWREAIRYTEEAQQQSEASGDQFRTISLLNNLGIYKFQMGDWSGAIKDGEQALTLAKRIGTLQQQLDLAINQGWRLIQFGDEEEAERHLSATLTQAHDKKLNDAELYSLVNLADLFLRRGDLDLTSKYLMEAQQLSQALAIRTELPEIHRNWALCFLQQGKLQAAQASIEHSLALAHELDATQQKGISLRVLGQLQVAQGQYKPALESFAESIGLLSDDPYEKARTQTQWAVGLLETGDHQQAREMLLNTKATFEQLGARRDVAIANKALAKLSSHSS